MILSHLNAGKALHKWGGGTKIGKIRQADPFVIFFWGGSKIAATAANDDAYEMNKALLILLFVNGGLLI